VPRADGDQLVVDEVAAVDPHDLGGAPVSDPCGGAVLRYPAPIVDVPLRRPWLVDRRLLTLRALGVFVVSDRLE
jgi:hypothetical protein